MSEPSLKLTDYKLTLTCTCGRVLLQLASSKEKLGRIVARHVARPDVFTCFCEGPADLILLTLEGGK